MVRKSALLVGCNYSNNPTIENKLHGCINDVNIMNNLIRLGCVCFCCGNDITILTDDTEKKPTFSNIIDALNQMIDAATPGDILLFYFSGGGALVNGVIPAIIPCDLIPITAKHILPIINRLPDKAIFTFICDSSYSGGLFDENVQTESNVPELGPNFHRKTIPSNLLHPIGATLPVGISLNNKILFSSSRANQESVEVYPNGNESKAFGAFSNAIRTFSITPEAVNSSFAGNDLNARYSIWKVAEFTRVFLGIQGFHQHPFFNHSDAAAPFLGNVA